MNAQIQRLRCIQMDIALRKSDHNARGAECIVDGLMQFRGNRKAVFQTVKITAQHQPQGVVVKALEVDQRCRIFQHAWILAGDLGEQLQRFACIAAVFDANGNHDPVELVGQCPVEQSAGDEFLVRNQQLLFIPIAYSGGADFDLADDAGRVTNGDDVTDPHRTLE